MINPIEAGDLSRTIADQLRVRLSYHSVELSYEDRQELVNFLDEMLSNYMSTALMSGENQDVKDQQESTN